MVFGMPVVPVKLLAPEPEPGTVVEVIEVGLIKFTDDMRCAGVVGGGGRICLSDSIQTGDTDASPMGANVNQRKESPKEKAAQGEAEKASDEVEEKKGRSDSKQGTQLSQDPPTTGPQRKAENSDGQDNEGLLHKNVKISPSGGTLRRTCQHNAARHLCHMAIEPFEKNWPVVPDCAFVAGSADVVGRVTLGKENSIWYGAVLRGDINEIRIGARSNVQDNAVIHLADHHPTVIGDLVTIGHGAIVHACKIEDEVLVGMGACVLDGAVIGKRSIIGAKALVTGGTVIPPGSLVLGSPAKVVRALTDEEQDSVKDWALKYVKNAARFLARDF